MPPNQVCHSFPHKKCINPCCNSVCTTENVVGYMPRQWQFKGTPNNLPPGGGTSACFMAWKSQGDHSQNNYVKKLKNDSNVEECSDYQKMPISWELLLYWKIYFSPWPKGSVKSWHTDFNESNKPTLKSLAHIGSEKLLVKLGVPKNKLFHFFSHFSLYWKVYFFTLSHGFPKRITLHE